MKQNLLFVVMEKTYLITGSSGYVGNRIVKVLCQNNIDNVTALKLVDKNINDEVRQTQETMCKKAGIAAEWIVADVTSKASVKKAVKHVDVVIHTVAIVDVFDYIPEEVMRNVFVLGTVNMVELCCSANVRHFIYTSSNAAVGPNTNADPFLMGDEDTPYLIKPGTFYAKYKHEAEQQVLAANGRKMANGETFVTCVLRPGGIFGGDNLIMKETLLSFKSNKVLVSPSSKSVLNNAMFVDNVAWCHILAAKKIQTHGSLIGGNVYFLGDDTPKMSFTRLMLVFFEPFGFTISKEPILPIWIMYIAGVVLAKVSKFLAFFNIHQKPLLTPGVVTLFSTTFTFSHKKFEKHFDYKPLVGWEESKERTREDLEEMIKIYA